MALRMEARRIGLAMQLAPQEWPHWLKQRAAEPLCAILPATTRQHAGNLELLAVGDRVCGLISGVKSATIEKLLPHFATLPANVYKVEADKQMIALYWGEKGEASDLLAIDALLKALA